MTKSPEFESSHLDVADFDGTMYDTFESSHPHGIYSVSESYKIAIEETFKFDRNAIKKYEDQGEHNNRTPVEIVQALAPECTEEGLIDLTNSLVKAKLNVLEKQIGRKLADSTPWPRPLPGFIAYSNAVIDSNAAGNTDIHRGVTSSGHASFIRRCLTQSGIKQPEILITDETIKGFIYSGPPSDFAKPSSFPLDLAKMAWARSYGIGMTDPDILVANARIKLIGDAEDKDGGMADNAGVDFILVKEDEPEKAWHSLMDIHGLLGQRALRE